MNKRLSGQPSLSASRCERKWQTADILRIFHNLVEAGKNKQTPSMRPGFAKGGISAEGNVYYRRKTNNSLNLGRHLLQKKGC
jgi:hypothetical protein